MLGVPTSQLLAGSTADAEPDVVRAVGAALLAVDEPISLTALAELCDSDLEAVRDAVDVLCERLAVVGGGIAESDHGVEMVADQRTVGDDDVVSRTVKRVHAREGLSVTEARLLALHRRGELSSKNFNADEHIAYARLLNGGLI